MALESEQLGFDASFRSDHYQRIGSGDLDAAGPGPTDAWAVLAGLARDTTHIRLGSGWFEAEHTSYGIPFPPVAERFDVLEEQLAVVTGLWATPVGERFSFQGAHYTLRESPALPKPVQQPSPVVIGGTVAEVVDKIGRLGDLGAARVYLQLMDLADLDQLRLVAAEVVPQL